MKSVQGLIVAIVLGLLGGAVNMYYLQKGRTTETIDFVGIRKGAKIRRGKPIQKSQLEAVRIPQEHVGNVGEYAVRFHKINTIVGRKAVRNYTGVGGTLFLLEDLRTPPTYLNLGTNDSGIGVTINTSTIVTSLIIPGVTPVSFYLPASRKTSAKTAGPDESWEWFGPFDVLTVGNRLGDPVLMRAEGISPKQQNILTLRSQSADGKPDPRVEELKAYQQRTKNTPLEVKFHSSVIKDKK